MCKQRTALETLLCLPDKGGLTAGQVKLAEAQSSDHESQERRHKETAEKMDARMTKIEEKVEVIDKKVDTMGVKIDKVEEQQTSIIKLLQYKASPLNSLKELLANKYILFILLVILSLAIGIPLSDVVDNFSKVQTLPIP